MTLSCFTVAFLLLASYVPAQCQTVKQDPSEKPRKVKSEIKKAYVDWLKDVDPLLTQAEREAWPKLRTDEEREQFIAIFWGQRDPDPDTEENEFKEEYYERLAYADEHFSSGKPGRLTDRGRIYLKFGKPDEIESHPAGGTYERELSEGGGSTSTYPFERWFYRHIAGVASGVQLEFVDPTGSGEYRLARNPDEKDALLFTPGAGPTIGELYGIDNRADRIAGLGSFGRANYQRIQDSPFEVMNLQADLWRAESSNRTGFPTGITHTPTADDSTLSLESQFNYFKLADGSVLVALTVQTENDDLVFRDSGGIQTAYLNIYGHIVSVADKRVGKFEDSVTTTALPTELTELKGRKSAYGKAFILQPGKYRLDLMVRDVNSGALGVSHTGFDVPSFPADSLAASSVVLATKLETTTAAFPTSEFMIGTTKVVPSLSHVFTRSQPVGVYLQIYNAGIDQTTLRPAVDVGYALMKDGKELWNQSEDWTNINDAGKRLILTRLLDTKLLTPGKYRLLIRIHDQISGQVLTRDTNFDIAP